MEPGDELSANLEMTLRQWVERYQKEIVFDRVHYRGLQTWKNVLDLWVYQEILWETETDLVVEIGVRHGGTTLWLADTLRTFRGPEARVIAIDLVRPPIEFPANIEFILGDSIAPETVATARERAAGRKVLVLADGDHSADHVLQLLRLYAPLIPTGSSFIAEDGIVDVMDCKEFTPVPPVLAEPLVA